MKNGFTLIELLIYLAITAAIVTSFTYFALNIGGGSEKSVIVTQVNNEAWFVLDFMAAKIREANTVSLPNATTLDLTMPTSPDYVFSLDANDNLQVDENPGPVTLLTSSNLQVTNLQFTNFAPTGERSNVGISFTLNTDGSVSPELAYTTSVRTAISRRK